MRKLLIIVVLLLSSIYLTAQPDTAWIRSFDTQQWDEWTAVTVDPVGNIYAAGWSYQWQVNSDWNIAKYDPSGNILWSKIVSVNPGADKDEAHHILYDPRGYIYVSGFMFGGSSSQGTITIVKYDVYGDSIWTFYAGSVGSGYPNAMKLDTAGNIYIAGKTDMETFVVKVDTGGIEQWTSTFNNNGPNQTNIINDMVIDDSGSVYVAGWCDDPVNFYTDLLTIKYTPQGDTAWLRIYNGPANYYDAARKIKIDAQGNVYVAGNVTSQTPMGSDFVLLKYDPNGNLLWDRFYNYLTPSYSFESPCGLEIDSAGNIYIAGISSYSNSTITNDLAIRKYTADGDTLWTKRWGTPNDDEPIFMQMVSTDELYIGGYYYTGSSFESFNAFIVRFDSSGSNLWQILYDNGAGGEDEFNAMNIDNNHDIIAAGRLPGTNFFDGLLIKYDISTVGEEEINLDKSSLSIWPNPASERVNILIQSTTSAMSRISIYGTDGKKVFNSEQPVAVGKNILSLDLKSKHFHPGMYIVEIFINNTLYTGKFIVD